jgi:hypothetical protein
MAKNGWLAYGHGFGFNKAPKLVDDQLAESHRYRHVAAARGAALDDVGEIPLELERSMIMHMTRPILSAQGPSCIHSLSVRGAPIEKSDPIDHVICAQHNPKISTKSERRLIAPCAPGGPVLHACKLIERTPIA